MLSFNDHKIISDCHLKCETGEIVGLLGRNGSGKSSLLKIIFGTLPVPNKIIRINHKNYSCPFKKQNLIAYLPQGNFLPQNITVANIVCMYFDEEEVMEKVFTDKRIKTYIDKKAGELSGGQLRYFELLLLLNLNTMFVLLDEPFSQIEPLYKELIIDLIKTNRKTKGFIITDHDYMNVIEASDSIYLLTNGVCKKLTNLQELEKYSYLSAGTFDEDTFIKRF